MTRNKKRDESVEAVITSPIGVSIILRDLGKLASLGCYYAAENPDTPKDVLLYIKNSEQLLKIAYSLIETLLDTSDEDVMDTLMKDAMKDIKNSLTEEEFQELMTDAELDRASGDVIEGNMMDIIRGLDDE